MKIGLPGGPGRGVLPPGGVNPLLNFLGRAGGVEFSRINQSLIRRPPPGGGGAYFPHWGCPQPNGCYKISIFLCYCAKHNSKKKNNDKCCRFLASRGGS